MKKWLPGSVYSIALPSGTPVTAVALNRPHVAFYAGTLVTATPSVWSPPLFVLAMPHDTLATSGWIHIGNAVMPAAALAPPPVFMQDIINPANLQILDAAGNVRPATATECEGLEPAAVWVAQLVEQRLEDHFAGRPNAHVEHMKLKR
jgi:hypothetical protein